MEDIYAPNKTLIIEDQTAGSGIKIGGGSALIATAGFIVNSNCTLVNLSVSVTNDADASSGLLQLRILQSIWDTGDSRNEPTDTQLYIKSAVTISDAFDGWINFTDLYWDLDTSTGDNNTFYVELRDTTDDTYWYYETEAVTGGPDDNSDVFDKNAVWDIYNVPPSGPTVDMDLKIHFGLDDNTPAPEDIGMEINGTMVSNGIGNSGAMTSTATYPSLNNQLNFTLDAGWWNVTCNITKIQVNYTKTSVYGIANFTATTTDITVYWNVTMSDLINDFEGKFENPYINFTIPTHWQNVEVWNGGTPQTISTTRSLGMGYNESQVLNPENGNFWFLKATTSNLISQIEGIRTYVNDIDVDTINYTKTKTIEINATFSQNIANDNGDFNLSVYNFDLPRYLNHTKDLTTFTGGTEINVNNWIVSNNVTEYGKFKVQIIWNNGTDAGFREKNITILGKTEMAISQLSKTTFNADKSFNITVLYNDTQQTKDITNPDINYTLNGIKWRYDNITYIGGGKYNITIFCNDSQFGGYGSKNILINANKTYYNNHSKSVGILILGKTNLTFIDYPGIPNFNSGDIFNITIEFNDTLTEQGIEADFIEYRLNDTASFRSDNYKYIGNGRHNITVYCNDTDFTNYGSYTITINANKTDYNNQSISNTLTITGKTELTADRYPNLVFYNSTKTFNITAHFRETERNKGVVDADITVKINGYDYTPLNFEPYGDGDYNITVNCSDNFFGEYGPATVTVIANKTNYYNDTIDVSVDIRGETSVSAVKVPYKSSYDSNDIFNITVYYNNTARNTGIIGANITVEVNETRYYTGVWDYNNGYYNITVNCSEDIFSGAGYGDFLIRVNVSQTYYYNQSTELNVNIGAVTSLSTIIYPLKLFYNSSETFNITTYYQDDGSGTGINGATIEVRINSQLYTPPLPPDNYAEGYYNITVECNTTEFNDYGNSTIRVDATRTNYASKYTQDYIYIIGETELTIVKVPDLAYYSSSGIFNITAYFNDVSRNQGINGTNIEIYVGVTPYSPIYVFDNGDGYYNISINCSAPIFSNYGLFTIRVDANKTNYYNQSLPTSAFIMGNTTLTLISPAQNSVRVGGTGIFTIIVDFEDILLASGVSDGFINYSINGQAFSEDILSWVNNGDGTYDININIDDPDFGTDYGFIDIIINVSKYKYFNGSFIFRIHRQIPTGIDPGISVDFGNIFRSENRSYTFNYTDNLNNPILGATVSNISSLVGFTWLLVVEGNGNYTISLNSTGVIDKFYSFLFRVNATGNQTQFITIDITVLKPNTEILSITTNLVGNVVPEGFNLTLNFNFTDAFKNIAITNIDYRNVSITHLGVNWSLIVNDTNGDVNFPNRGWMLIHNGDGNYTLNISTYLLTRGNLYTITIIISYASSNPGPYNVSVITLEFYYASAPAVPSDGGGGGGGGGGGTKVTGIPFETLMLYIIIAAAIGGGVAAIVGIQKGVIAPKKREKERILREVTTIFDDAINLQHILVIYKTSGTCVFFKSYGIEEIDPELISGFLSAVSSFGREMDSQEALNEIQYGDKMLLLADGEFIRVALVLDKEASIILRQHLKDFIDIYEEKYASDLPDWRGQLAAFRDSGEIIDQVFSTSIILPHQVKIDTTKVKALKSPHSKDVLKIASSLVAEDSDKKYFFIATLLVEATDKTGKEKSEVFMGIKELRDNNILTPIEIDAIEKPPITQQELDLIRQQVNDLPDLSEEEIVEITNNLAKMGPAEREAYLASSRERAVVVSAPIKTTVGTAVIDNVKSAKKEIKNLKKLANTALKRKNTQNAIEIYNNAAVIATNWDLTKEFEELEDIIRITTINDLKATMKVLESKAKVASKAGDYPEATEKYAQAARAASEIFKLGITEMTKEVKRLTNKSKEYERLS